MPTRIELPWPPPNSGAYTKNNGFRNGVAPPAEKIRRVYGDYGNRIGAQRHKILFQKSIRYTEAYDTAAAADTWRFQFHTSPNVGLVRIIMVVGQGNFNPSSVTRDPKVIWTTTIVGGASKAQANIYHSDYDASTSAVVPDGMVVIKQDWIVTGDTKYIAQMEQTDQLRVLSASVHELPRTVLSSAETNVINPLPYTDLAPIYDVDAADIQTVTTKWWKTMGTHHFAWCVDSNVGATVATPTWTNLVDGTTTAIGAATQGFYTWPLYHGALDGYDSGASTEVIPVTLYAYMKTSNGSNEARVRFVDATGTIGTLTSTSTTGEWVTSDVNWTVSTSDSAEKVDVQFSNASAPTITTVMAAGMYEYEA